MTIATTIGGVTAPPSRDAPCVRPCAKPRRLIGIQCRNARVAAAKAPPSPTPTRNRHTINADTPVATPVITVATLQSALNSARLARGPNLSASQPPGICMNAYEYANAEKMTPSWVGLRPISFRMNGPATEMLTRSMYRMNAIRQRLNSVRWRIFMGELISDTVPPKRRIGFQTEHALRDHLIGVPVKARGQNPRVAHQSTVRITLFDLLSVPVCEPVCFEAAGRWARKARSILSSRIARNAKWPETFFRQRRAVRPAADAPAGSSATFPGRARSSAWPHHAG